ncbi:oxidoreductase [Pontibacillus halophilus JSM 076056 = DSM 19796]|uniref:Oxidoreductase n=1 Tax=Pontibacillus halophilus JSM 076056 = DSM 19796 TaxID=1385510 RepID=A0A0A5GJP3_9BACI|nr:DoxX family protein [Pontibacillus halophilus]KGX91375.1 oxidoreductase [Pontibacillus halophilus JSM 076056 = DSM 19796]
MDTKQVEWGLFVGRLVLGAIMFAHGVQKLMNMGGTVNMFQDMLGLPGFLAYMTAGIEVLAGLAVILGLYTRISSLLLGFVMVGAIVTVKLPMVGFFGNGQMAGWELDLALLGLSVVLTLSGSRFLAITKEKTKRTSEQLSA